MRASSSRWVAGGTLALLVGSLSLAGALERAAGLWGEVGRVSALLAIVLALAAVVLLAYAGIGSLGRRR